MKFKAGWSSHYPILIKIMNMTSGPVLELGSGPFSTPLLHWLCLDQGRELFTYDNDQQYIDLLKNFRAPWHHIIKVDDWHKIDIDNKAWSLAFVDHAPANRRREDLKRLVNNTQFVLLHDTQPEDDKYYRHERVYPRFKYRFDYMKKKPWTSVLSNFVNLQEVLK